MHYQTKFELRAYVAIRAYPQRQIIVLGTLIVIAAQLPFIDIWRKQCRFGYRVCILVHFLLTMNSWIQRNIIFPKISQHYQQYHNSNNQKSTDPLLPSSIKLPKKASLNCMPNSLPRQSRKNYSIHIRNMDPGVIVPTKRARRLDISTIQSQQYERSSSVRKRLALLGLQGEEKNIFQSGSSRNIPKKNKLNTEECLQQPQKMAEIDIHLHAANIERQLTRKKTSNLKLKTQPIHINLYSQRQYPHRQICNGSLSIHKAATYDYNQLPKCDQTEREMSKRRHSKVKVVEKFEEAGLKITSIRGWNHMEQTQMMPQYSYIW